MPGRLSVGIGDFRIIYDTRNTVRVFNGVSGVQIVHSPLQRGVTVAARSQIPRGVQVHFCQQNIAEGTIILHLVGIGVHGVGIFVVGNAGGVCGVGLICIADAKGDSNDALAGVDKRAATVGRSDVGVIIRVPQPNRLTVQRFGDFKGIRPLAQHRARRAGSIHICPVAIVPTGSTTLHNDELTLIALRIEQIIRTARIVTVVDDLVSAVALALDLVLVVPTIGNVALPNGIPLENFEFSVTLDALLGFAVDFVDADLYRPFIVLHFIVIGTISRNSNSLVAAQRTGCGIKTVRDGDFIIAKFQIIEVTMYRRQRCFDFTIDLTFTGALRSRLCRRCLCVCILLTVGGYAAALGCRLADAVMYRPCSGGITAIEVVAIVLRVTACGHRLIACRGNRPAAAVDVGGDAIQNRGNVDACTVHLLQRFQLDFVRVDAIRKIQRFGALIAGTPRFVHRLPLRGKFWDLVISAQRDRGVIQNDKPLPRGVAGDIQRANVHRFCIVVCIDCCAVHNLTGKAVRKLLCLPRKAVKIGVVVGGILGRASRNRGRCAAVEALCPHGCLIRCPAFTKELGQYPDTACRGIIGYRRILVGVSRTGTPCPFAAIGA